MFGNDRKDSGIPLFGRKRSCLKYTLNACKLINGKHLFNSNMRISVLIKHHILFIDNSQANLTNSNRKMKCCCFLNDTHRKKLVLY